MPFRTDSLPLASFLFTTKRLMFLRREPSGSRLAFVFDDPEGLGESLQIAFESGAECPAAAFYDSVRHLRRIMTRVQSRSNEHAYNQAR